MEVWKGVPGFETRYQVSSEGRIRSTGYGLMRPSRNYAGYLVVKVGGRQCRLHCLILEAFVGPRPAGMQGCHRDDDKENNHLGNLRWDTPKGNIADRRSFDGDLNPNARLTNDQRDEIRRRRRAGEPLMSLAAEFGVTRTRVSQIFREKVAV